MKTRNVLPALVLGCVLFSSAVHATLVDVVNKNYSYDASTRLKWLDLTETAGISYNAIANGIGNTWIADGWRYASAHEIKYLLQSNLPSAITSNSSEGSPRPGDCYAYNQPDSVGDATRLVSLLGDTYGLLGYLTPGSTGIYGREIPSSDNPNVSYAHNIAAILTWDSGNSFFVTMQGGAQDAYGHGYVGHFLVSVVSVPEPTSLALFGLGLASPAFSSRRKS